MVEFKVRLNILSKEEFTDLQRDTMQLESLAKRQVAAKTKAKGKEPTGGIFGGEGEGSLPSAIIKKRRKAELSREVESSVVNKVKGAVDKSLSSGKAPIQKANAFKDLQKQVSRNTQATKVMQKGMQEFDLLRQIGAGGAGGLARMGLGIAKKIIPIALAIGLAEKFFEIWAKSYGAGGVNDPRKLILDDVTSVIGLERETNILSGKQFFANSRTLKQGQEIQTNTQNMRDGFYRTSLLRAAYGRP